MNKNAIAMSFIRKRACHLVKNARELPQTRETCIAWLIKAREAAIEACYLHLVGELELFIALINSQAGEDKLLPFEAYE